MMKSVEQSVEQKFEGENLPQCQIVSQKSHTMWPGLESEQPRWEAGD
jgi:hypothetical protein